MKQVVSIQESRRCLSRATGASVTGSFLSFGAGVVQFRIEAPL